MRRTVIVCTLALAALGALAAAGPAKAQNKALKEAFSLHTSPFSVPNEFSELAWERAISWVSLRTTKSLTVATDLVIQTYPAKGMVSKDLACEVNRRRDADETMFTGDCYAHDPFAPGRGYRGTAMLVRYIMTGDPNCLDDGYSKRDAAECFLDCSAGPKACVPRQPELLFPEGEDIAVEGDCTLEQITAMAKAGLSDKQINAACGGDG